MNKKRIALIGYNGSYFSSFGKALESCNFEVYWVCTSRYEANYLMDKLSISENKILDISIGVSKKKDYSDEYLKIIRNNLSLLESKNPISLYNIILMDRILRHKTTSDALLYLGHIEKELSTFLKKNEISLVTSGRDTALQLMSMIISKKLGITWVVPTRLRVPSFTYGFCNSHETDSFLKFNNPTKDDREWAIKVIENFNHDYYKPGLKLAARTIGDVVLLLPLHFYTFIKLLRNSYWDWGNNYHRHSIKKTISLFFQRKRNMIAYKTFPKFECIGSQPFCLYALHTQPESSIDVSGAYFSDQIALITFIARSLPVSHELYVKVHPTDVDGKPLSFYKRISKLPGVRLISYSENSKELAKLASIIFTITGTIGLEAGLMGKNVITFAKNYYNQLPTVYYCDSPPQLPDLIKSLFNNKAPENIQDLIVDFLTKLRSNTFDGEFNRGGYAKPESLTPTDLVTLQRAYNILFNNLCRGNSVDFKE